MVLIDYSVGHELRTVFPNNHLLQAVGLLLYAMAIIQGTPLGGFFRQYENRLMSSVLFLSIAYFIFDNQLHFSAWTLVTSDLNFQAVPTSAFGFWGWLSLAIGAATYLGIYAMFQIWYTRGNGCGSSVIRQPEAVTV